MTGKLTRFVVYALTILSANYLSDLFLLKLNEYKQATYLSVFYGMLILILVYVPCFALIEKFVKKASQSYVRTSKSVGGSSKKGLVIGGAVAFLILFSLYSSLWIQKSPFDELLALLK